MLCLYGTASVFPILRLVVASHFHYRWDILIDLDVCIGWDMPAAWCAVLSYILYGHIDSVRNTIGSIRFTPYVLYGKKLF